MDNFITECLFSIRLTSFKRTHFKISIDITPMSVFRIRRVTVHFNDVFQKAVRGEDDKERTLFVFFFFPKTTKFCCNRECTQKK